MLVLPDGALAVSDDRGGITRIGPDGSCDHLPCPGGPTNGVARDRDGSLILAGIDTGTIHRLRPDGTAELVLDQFEGEKLGAVNFVHFDPAGGLWITVSTRVIPRSRAIESAVPDGYMLKLTPSGPRLMATGFCFANEIRIDPGMQWVYLAESALGRVLRLPIRSDGTLGKPEPFGPEPLFPGAIVDGLAFDVEGGLWVTEVTRNGIHRIDRDGAARCLFEDPEANLVNFPASIAFGGNDRKTVFVGSIRLDHVLIFRSTVAGAPASYPI
ncbi:SMP-30/gluconolactonase/LRE family protein [Xanthobacter autotrophicus]|uniref:SMP-30/gluconolactonase/LRE family protein n=1 Tax=Xanthobacter autotrophicus TaxID=280 RepID=UPI0024A74DBD|nr:SMP-30/gluconolactonase/LRE family protein [Xanthobacter autotrophicus]MDI4655328.1 SMP-30/gluconolactonase/LRE family protein [Xanthobacter autotrophicus]